MMFATWHAAVSLVRWICLHACVCACVCVCDCLCVW